MEIEISDNKTARKNTNSIIKNSDMNSFILVDANKKSLEDF